MKRHRNPHGSRSRDLASSARGEMRLALGVLAVFVEKHRLDEQQIGAAQETCKSLPVAWVVGHIRDIADLPSGYENGPHLAENTIRGPSEVAREPRPPRGARVEARIRLRGGDEPTFQPVRRPLSRSSPLCPNDDRWPIEAMPRMRSIDP